MADRTIFHCTSCGAEFSSKNARRSFSPRFKACFARNLDEPVLPVCSVCLGAEFNKLNTYYGERKTALFYFALFCDLPIYRDHIKKLPDSDAFLNKWFQAVEPYCAAFEEVSFRDGDITKLEDLDLPKGKAKPDEEQGGGRWPGCKEAREEWNDDDLSYADYKRLEKLEEIQNADKVAVDETGKLAIKKWCKYTLLEEKAANAGKVAEAEKYQKLAKNELEYQGLLKIQENPSEIDAMSGAVVEIENIFGSISQWPELRERIYALPETILKQFDWDKTAQAIELIKFLDELPGKSFAEPHPLAGKSFTYNMSMDIITQMEIDIINHMRRNYGQEAISELPEDCGVVDYMGECKPDKKQLEWEKKVLSIIGIYPQLENVDEIKNSPDLDDEQCAEI